jgi:hypothetical protein
MKHVFDTLGRRVQAVGQKKLKFPTGQTWKRNLLWNCLVNWKKGFLGMLHRSLPFVSKKCPGFRDRCCTHWFSYFELFVIVIMLW